MRINTVTIERRGGGGGGGGGVVVGDGGGVSPAVLAIGGRWKGPPAVGGWKTRHLGAL